MSLWILGIGNQSVMKRWVTDRYFLSEVYSTSDLSMGIPLDDVKKRWLIECLNGREFECLYGFLELETM